MLILEQQCTPITLPSGGIISFGPSSVITLASNVIFEPHCTETAGSNADFGAPENLADGREPFYASTTPQTYATAAATVIAWMLVVMLIITPRTFFIGSGGIGGSGFLSRRGIISGATGGTSIIGVGSRPWLQKAAALTVAVSLTIATADTFKVAASQYANGYLDATALRNDVVGGLEIKITRIISDIFLWLAQVQTLIRLFPRHKEKVIIKWVGFGLIVLDTTFSCLNSFLHHNTSGRQRRFVSAIPALSYLFQLALSLLYAAWVLYYAVTKRRYAFYHSTMKNICLVAVLSIVAILTPVVFFITDISNPDIAGWGDYFRWVGAAAASVVVWEWVERIEALEREEKKDGILGREIYDGDEMLEFTPSEEVTWPRPSRPDDPAGGAGGGTTTGLSGGFGHMAQRLTRARRGQDDNQPNNHEGPLSAAHRLLHPRRAHAAAQATAGNAPTPPPAAVTPASRADTTSAVSTVYAVHYHPISTTSPKVRRSTLDSISPSEAIDVEKAEAGDGGQSAPRKPVDTTAAGANRSGKRQYAWLSALNPFNSAKSSPPPEVRRARDSSLASSNAAAPQSAKRDPKWAIKSKVTNFVSEQADRLGDRSNPRINYDLPVTRIPAQPRGRTWSPEILHQARASPVGASQTTAPPVQTASTDILGRSIPDVDGQQPQFSSRGALVFAEPPRGGVFQSASDDGEQRVSGTTLQGTPPGTSSAGQSSGSARSSARSSAAAAP